MAISSLFRRLGFLKLDDYGLILTPEGRILSTRPAVLDDGLGGKIVGWREGDLAAMELERWHPAPASARATANRTAIAAPVAAPAAARPVSGAVAVVASPGIAMAPLGAKRAPTPMPLETQPMIRVDAGPDDSNEPLEDEWEWQIAVARARARAEWAEEAAQQARPVAAASPPDLSKATPAAPRLPRITQATPVTPTRPVQLVAAPASTARTVIPVPTLARDTDPAQLQPPARILTGAVPVRPSAAVMSPAPRRLPRGTARSDQPSPASFSEDTQVTFTAPANDDLTSPGMMAISSSASNVKRVAAKQR
jgi:hypothetical protein